MKNEQAIANQENGEIWKCWNPDDPKCRAFSADITNKEKVGRKE